MVSLIAKTPCAGLLPVSHGTVTLDEVVPEAITSVMPHKGQEQAVSETLKRTIGTAFPAPGRAAGKAGARVVWSGARQALVLGAGVAVEGAAVTDQSDGWACLSLAGEGARDVLARLVPLDLRPEIFKTGHAARTLLGHMTCALWREGRDRYTILVFRSMARTAVHELETAMKSLAAQAAPGTGQTS